MSSIPGDVDGKPEEVDGKPEEVDGKPEEVDLGVPPSHYVNTNPFVEDAPIVHPQDAKEVSNVDISASPPPPPASPPPSPPLPLPPPPSPLRGVDSATNGIEDRKSDDFALHHLPHDRSIAPPRPPPPPSHVRGAIADVRGAIGGVSDVHRRGDNDDIPSPNRLPRGRSSAPPRPSPPPSGWNASDAVDGDVGGRNPFIRRSSTPSRPSPPRSNVIGGRVNVNASSLSRDGPGLPMHVSYFNGQNAQVRVAFPHLPELEGLRDEDSF